MKKRMSRYEKEQNLVPDMINKMFEIAGHAVTYEDIKDLCYRTRPNRMMIQALAEHNALDCLTDILQFEYLEDFMVHWDELVTQRTQEEKNAARLKKLADKNSLSIDQIMSNKVNDKPTRNTNKFNTLLSDNLFD